MVKLARVLATWFGCGRFPWGPGSIGSAAGLLLGILLAVNLEWSGWQVALVGLALAPVGIWAAGVEEHCCGRQDPGQVVIDEVVGQLLTFAGALALNPLSFLMAYLLFRFFDVVKPPPARQLERLHGGLGIMADDMMAGVYAAVTLSMAGYLGLY
jgi:phosphatidylglycerophosphatase A